MITPVTLPGPVELDAHVTIGIAAYGNHVVTKSCLEALFASATGDYELILVDDCSPDNGEIRALFQSARSVHANTRIFAFTENLEYTGSLNAILSHAQGEQVLFISNDIYVTPLYLAGLVESLRANPQLGIVRGSSNFVDNANRVPHNVNLARHIDTPADLLMAGVEVAKYYGGQLVEDEFLTGDAFMVSRALLNKIGCFDPMFYGYFADHDLGIRAKIAGFQTALMPGAFAYHKQAANFDYLSADQREAKLSRRWMRIYENWARFKMKYGLPVAMEYPGVNDIPWEQLGKLEFDAERDYSGPGDYLKYVV